MADRCFRVVVAALCILILPVAAAAEPWEDIWERLSFDDTIESGVEQRSSTYNADIRFTITDGDGNSRNFRGSDTINLTIRGSGDSLRFQGTSGELTDWANENAAELMSLLFGNAPDRLASGTTTAARNVQDLFAADPAPAGGGANEKNPFAPVSTKDIVMKGQYDTVSIGYENDTASDGSGFSGLLNYGRRFGPDLADTIGIGIPFRQMSLKDDLNTDFLAASFLPYYKHRWYGRRSVLEGMVNLAANLSHLESDLFPEGAAYFEFGAGTGLKAGFQAAPRCDLTAGVALEFLKRKAPSSLVPEELRWLSDAISALPLQKNLIPSAGVLVRLVPQRLTFRGEIFRVMQLQSQVEEGTKNQTVAMGILSLRVGRASEVAVGYKRSFEVRDLTDASYTIDLRLRF